MDNRADIRDFLATRRARLRPEEVGLPPGNRRRVPGLRREEVAVLAGVSTEWYARLEKGHIAEVSEEVLTAVARALRLDDGERMYLLDLARAARPTPARRRRKPEPVPPSAQWLLDSMTLSAAFVGNGRLDVLAINALGRAMYSQMFDDAAASSRQGGPDRPANFARFNFLDPQAHHFYDDWEAAADTTVALLRAQAGRDPDDKSLRELVGDLSTLSPDFRTLWAKHDVRQHHAGIKHFHHPDVGPLELTYHALQLSTSLHDVHTLTTYTAEPDSPSEERFRLLASLAAPSAHAGPRPATGS